MVGEALCAQDPSPVCDRRRLIAGASRCDPGALDQHSRRVYVGGGHGMTGDLKVSLHASADWRHAFSREHYREPAPFAPPKRRRAFSRWRRPAESAPGYNRAFQVLVPDEHIVTPQDAAIHDLDVLGAESRAWTGGLLHRDSRERLSAAGARPSRPPEARAVPRRTRPCGVSELRPAPPAHRFRRHSLGKPAP
jgi:hypothetical protein